jgi:hypothetical protein
MHQSLTNASSLTVGMHSQRPESQRRPTVDRGPAAHHMSNYVVALFGDDRELGDDVTVRSKRFDQKGFGGGGSVWPGKGGGVKGEDAVVVTWQFASQEHAYSLPDHCRRAPLTAGWTIDAANRRGISGATFVVGDVTSLESADLGTFDFFLDVGCFQGLNSDQRLGEGRGVSALAIRVRRC